MRKALIVLLAVALLVPLAAAQEQGAAQETRYVDNSFARLSHLVGTAFLQRAQELGYEDVEVNTPIAEGDRIGTTDGRLEIFLGKRVYIRLDQNSKVDFASLPRRDNGITRIRQWSGHMYLDIGQLAKEKSIEVLTDDATFYILDKGLYRIDVREGGGTEILVFQGMVEAAGEEGSMLVKDAQRIALQNGAFQGKPAGFFAASAEDAFDRFNSTRLAAVHRTMARSYLPEELSDYESELGDYGEWAESPEFGWVWIPRGLPGDWRPYSWGRWTWLSMAGWCWVPYEPWGWGPFHYGRWHWSMGWGWHWIPMGGWGPGWVNWWWGNDYWGWAPLSYWGYPGYLYNNMYYGRGWQGDYPIHSGALTVIRKDQLQARNIHKLALTGDALKSTGKIILSNRMPDFRPNPRTSMTIEPLDSGKVILRQGGANVAGPGGAAAGQEGRVIRDTQSSGSKTGSDSRTVDNRAGGTTKTTSGTPTKTTSGSGTATKSGEGTTVKKGESSQGTPPPAKTTGERKIRKQEGESRLLRRDAFLCSRRGLRLSLVPLHHPRKHVFGPSSGSVLGNVYRRLSGSSSGASYRGSSSSSSGRSSSGTVSRGSSSSSGRSSSGSVSRGSSSSGRSSGSSSSGRSSGSSSGRSSGGGSVRKK